MIADRSQPFLKITTLGSFSVRCGNKILSDNSSRSGMVWKLFKFILTNRSAPIAIDKIIDTLWPDEGPEDPQKALYTLMYRLRGLLNSGFTDDCNFITFSHNCYIWNTGAPYELDVDEFDAALSKARSSECDDAQRIALCRRALELYAGDYLSESAFEGWVLPAANHYRRLYSNAVTMLTTLYAAAGDYASVIDCCEKAIAVDPFEESHHCALINALIELGRYTQAMAQYEYITGMLYRELGINPSDQLQELLRRIQRHTEDVQYDFSSIKGNLQEQQSQTGGAFCCDLATFREIYQLERRSLERSRASAFLVCLSVLTPQHTVPTNDTLSRAFPLLKRTAVFNLRRGDVVSQFSRSQLLMILSGTSYESCEVVVSRLIKRFETDYSGEAVRVSVNMDSILADSLDSRAI